MCEKADLSLNLSMKCTENPPPYFPMNLKSMIQQSTSPPAAVSRSPPGSKTRERPSHREIDINQPPPPEDHQEVLASSPDSTITILSGKRSVEEAGMGSKTAYGGTSAGGSDEEDGSDTVRKKLKMTKEQTVVLERVFNQHRTLNQRQKDVLARQLNLQVRQVEVWFQNRRARTKLKQTELERDLYKKRSDNQEEEIKLLRKELNELKAMKYPLLPPINLNSPATFTMYRSRERMKGLSASSPASASVAPTRTTTIARRLKPATPIMNSLHLKDHHPNCA